MRLQHYDNKLKETPCNSTLRRSAVFASSMWLEKVSI